jgi:hypothetical protein
MRANRTVLVLGAGLLAVAGGTTASQPTEGTYWQDRKCSKDYQWCVRWVRIGHGSMEIGCVFGFVEERGSDDGNTKGYLVDETGRRYESTATLGAAAYGPRPAPWPDGPRGSYVFPIPSGAGPFAFHDDERGRRISDIKLDPTRFTSPSLSRALLAGIRDADKIVIRDAWKGLGTSRDRRIHLARTADGFAGTDLDVAQRGLGPAPSPAPSAVRLSAADARRVLGTLADSAAFEGEYTPSFAHTDDYPDLRVEVSSRGETFTFSSESQGADHVPWALHARGRSWVVPSSHPGRALRLVRAFLDGTPLPEPDPAEEAPHVLRIAAQKGDVAEVGRRLAKGDDPNRRTPYDGETPLTAAARWGREDAVRKLLSGGADPRRTNGDGATPFQVASRRGHASIVQLLLSVDPGTRVGSGRPRRAPRHR